MSKPSLSFLSASKPAEDLSPPWRADFRDTSRLPDLKVVRTDFLVNYGLFGLAVIVLGYTGFVEYGHWSLGKEIEEYNQALESRTVQNARHLKNSGLFSARMKYVDEFVKFKTPRMDCLDMLVALGEFKPEGLTVGNVTVDAEFVDQKTKKQKVRVVMSGSKKGGSSKDIIRIGSEFQRFAKQDLWTRDKGFVLRVPPSSPAIVLNPQTQTVDFTFELFLETK